jgi:hypothetical protein
MDPHPAQGHQQAASWTMEFFTKLRLTLNLMLGYACLDSMARMIVSRYEAFEIKSLLLSFIEQCVVSRLISRLSGRRVVQILN